MQSSILQKLIALPYNDLGRDQLVHKYKGCWLFVKTEPDSIPVLSYFYGLSNDFMLFRNKDEFEFRVSLTGNCEVFHKFPQTGIFQYNDRFVVAHRIPARQYRRAPCCDNVQIINPITKLSKYGSSTGNLDIDIDILESSYNPVYYSIEQAEGLFKENESIYSVALTKSFGYSLHPHTDDKRLLWYLTTPIAEVDVTNKIFEMKVEVFNQEVQDFIRKERMFEWKTQ